MFLIDKDKQKCQKEISSFQHLENYLLTDKLNCTEGLTVLLDIHNVNALSTKMGDVQTQHH